MTKEVSVAEMIQTIMRARGFKTRKELAEYLSKKYNIDVYKLPPEEIVKLLWQEYIFVEMGV